MHHGELEMGGRVVHRDAGVLGDRHHDEGDEGKPERNAKAHSGRGHDRGYG